MKFKNKIFEIKNLLNFKFRAYIKNIFYIIIIKFFKND